MHALNSRERMSAAMRLEQPDRVPVMCQLALGHYFLHADQDALEIWHDSRAFGDALLQLQREYSFDGVLINLPGRDPHWRDHIRHTDKQDGVTRITWDNGRVTELPADDLPQTNVARSSFEAVDPDSLFYVEPYGLFGLELLESVPEHQFDTVRYVRERAPDVSMHAEVFSPFSQLLELFSYEDALIGLLDDPDRAKAFLSALCRGTTELMAGYAEAGADAILISSAFAGGGFIGTEHYRDFVLPFERHVIKQFHAGFPDVPVYTHTCGAIGDRLELMAETQTQGIDTLDPPPLGTVELDDAKRRVGGRLFIKGNMDPVNTLLGGTPEQVYADAVRRIRTAAPGGGYILSTACSVAPHTPPENILQLARAAETEGRYT